MNSFQWNANDYARNSNAQQKWALELLQKMQLCGNESVLDIGCGDGKITAQIAGQLENGYVHGIDSSAAMIQLAQASYPQAEYPNLSFEQMNAKNISLKTPVDVAFSNAALHWVDDQLAVLIGLYKNLKPGGKIFLQMGGKGNAANILSVLDDLISCEQWRPYFEGFIFPYTFPGDEEYAELLSKVGFETQRSHLLNKNMEHEGVGGIAGWIRTTWLPYTHRVPEDKRELFINLIVNKYIENRPPNSDGIVELAMVRLEVEARKPS